jgi:DNA or RNA helicases of superfamily II
MIALRDYQQEALREAFIQRTAGITRQLVALPTGCGKTLLFGALVKELNTRTIVIAHREELLSQARDKILLVWPEADIGIIKAEQNEVDHQVIVASIQTISRAKRLAELQEQGFNLMIVDEAHHTISQSYIDVIKGLGFMDDDPNKLLLGVTATPWRLDGQGLDNVFQKIVFQRSLPTMIKAGYLSDLQAIRVKAGTNLVGIHTRMGDFAPGELEAAVNTMDRNKIIVDSFKKYASARKAAAFCAGVQHCKDLAKAFQEAGMKAEAVYGDMNTDYRKSILKAYGHGEIQVLTNCEVLTEGWDDESTDCLLMCRPTKSKGLYTQMIGRGTRLFPGKDNCLILEFTDNRHDICSLESLSGLLLKDKQSLRQAIQQEEERQEQAARQVSSIKKIVAKEYDIFDRSQFRWFAVGADWRLPVGIDEYIHLHHVEPDIYTVTLVQLNNTNSLSPSALPLGYAQGIAEDYARANAKIFASKEAKWTKKPATEKQLITMDNLHIKYPENISTGDAAQLIGQRLAEREVKQNEPATPKQMYALRAAGFNVGDDLTKGQAYLLFKQLGEQKTIKM